MHCYGFNLRNINILKYYKYKLYLTASCSSEANSGHEAGRKMFRVYARKTIVTVKKSKQCSNGDCNLSRRQTNCLPFTLPFHVSKGMRIRHLFFLLIDYIFHISNLN